MGHTAAAGPHTLTSPSSCACVRAVCISPDGATMIVLDHGNGKVRKVNMATQAVTTLLSGQDNSMDCTFAPNSGGASFYLVQQRYNNFQVCWASLVMALAPQLAAPATRVSMLTCHVCVCASASVCRTVGGP